MQIYKKGIPKQYRFRKVLVSKKVTVLVSKSFGIDKSIGIGFGKNLVSKKVLDSVSKKLVSEKSFGFGFEQIFDFVTHWIGRHQAIKY